MPWSDSSGEWEGDVGGVSLEELSAQNAYGTYELLTRTETDLYADPDASEAEARAEAAEAEAKAEEAECGGGLDAELLPIAMPPDGWGGGDPYAAYGLEPPQPPVHEEWARGLLFLRATGRAVSGIMVDGAVEADAHVPAELPDPHIDAAVSTGTTSTNCRGLAAAESQHLAVVGRSLETATLGGGGGEGRVNHGDPVSTDAGDEEIFAQHGVLQEVFESATTAPQTDPGSTGAVRRSGASVFGSPPMSPVAAIEDEARGLVLSRVWGRCAGHLALLSLGGVPVGGT